MKNISLLAILAICQLVSLPVYAGEIAAESKITDVTIFPDSAMVRRVAAVQLEKGENVVTFDNLPVELVENTLRVEGKGTAQARISGVSVRKVFPVKASDKRIREIESEMESLKLSLKKIDAKMSSNASQKAFIDSIRVGWSERISRELAAGKPVTSELGEASRFVGEQVLKLEEGNIESDVQKKPLNEKLVSLKRELDELKGSGVKENRSVDVVIDSPSKMKFDIVLESLFNQAHLEPFYNLRLAPDGKSAELEYRSFISQRTGEDWSRVNMSISTSRPSAGSAPPELNAWRIYFREPLRPMARGERLYKAAIAPAPLAAEAAAGFAQDDIAGAVSSIESRAFVDRRQTSLLFKLPQPVDIPGDGSRRSTLVSRITLPVKAEYVAIPKLVQNVYLKSEVENSSSYPLLSGAVNVFNDTFYTGRSFLKNVASGEKLDLYFGADPSVKIKRTESKTRSDAGIISGNKISWDYMIEVENYKDVPVSMTLYEQIPVAGNEEIKVNVSDAAPTITEKRGDGTLLWKLDLKSGEKRKITYHLDVEYPKGKELAGAD